ncbi:MAG TPA: hypothetical protein VMR74_00235 [Gammaproteobacteria bacterium]|nr:hypothetical protein [Gammaproteobacteria bacterium]
MKNRLLIVGFILHFGLSLGGFVGLYGWAVGAQDAGTVAPSLGWVEVALRFVLLQPLAHWVLEAAPVAWWTWSGLASIAVLFGLNSAIVGAVVAVFLRSFRRRWR